MLYAFHLIEWLDFPDFWGGVVLIVKKYVSGNLTGRFWHVWIKAVAYSSTHWKGALEISTSMEAALFVAWRVDKFLMRYHSRFLRDANAGSKK